MNKQLSGTPDAHGEQGFAIEAFSVLGYHEGSGWWDFDQLSAKWTGICRELIDFYGAVFDHQWTGDLQQVRTRLTSVFGAGIITLFINDRSAASILILSGLDLASEHEVAEMYVHALRSAVPEQLLANDHNFSSVFSLRQRPVMVVVPFPDGDRSESDGEIARELGWHFAAALLQSWSGQLAH